MRRDLKAVWVLDDMYNMPHGVGGKRLFQRFKLSPTGVFDSPSITIAAKTFSTRAP